MPDNESLIKSIEAAEEAAIRAEKAALAAREAREVERMRSDRTAVRILYSPRQASIWPPSAFIPMTLRWRVRRASRRSETAYPG